MPVNYVSDIQHVIMQRSRATCNDLVLLLGHMGDNCENGIYKICHQTLDM